MTESVIITAIIMLGIILSIAVWQIFSTGETAVSGKTEQAELMEFLGELKKEIGLLRKEISEGE